MAALKCSPIALLAILSLVVCSAHRILPTNEAGYNNEHVVRKLNNIPDPDRRWRGNDLSSGGGGGGGGGVVISNPTSSFGGIPTVGSAGGYGSGSGRGNGGNNNGGSGNGGGGGGGGWVGGVPSYGVPVGGNTGGSAGGYGSGGGFGGVPNYGVPNYGVPIGGNNGGAYGYGSGQGYGHGGDSGSYPPGYVPGVPGGYIPVPPVNEPFHCQPINCGNPYGCPPFTMYFNHPASMNGKASTMPDPSGPDSTNRAMAPAESG